MQPCMHASALRCSHYAGLLPFRVYKSFLLSFRITLNNVSECECAVIRRGQAEKGGQGPLSRWWWRGGTQPPYGEEIWPRGLVPAPVGLHVTEERHLQINLPSLLPFFSLSFISPSCSIYSVLQSIKINLMFIVCLCLTCSSLPQVALWLCVCREGYWESKV